jgi:hypothetical protein
MIEAAAKRRRRCCSANNRPPTNAPTNVLISRVGAIWLTGALVIAIKTKMYEIGFRVVTPNSSGLFVAQYFGISVR